MPYGYRGNILHVDLTEGTIETEHPDDAFYRQYLGGSAMGMHYLLAGTPPRVRDARLRIPVECGEAARQLLDVVRLPHVEDEPLPGVAVDGGLEHQLRGLVDRHEVAGHLRGGDAEGAPGGQLGRERAQRRPA